MGARKNIFLIARRGHHGDEDQLTELLACLWQEDQACLERWLSAIGLEIDFEGLEVETQFELLSGKRPDMRITTVDSHILVESKPHAEAGGPDGRGQTARGEGRGAPDGVCWQEMGEVAAEPGEESLAGDFVQMLVREGLVKPAALTSEDWGTWNRGYHVLLRLDTFLTEFEPHARRLLPGAVTGQPRSDEALDLPVVACGRPRHGPRLRRCRERRGSEL